MERQGPERQDVITSHTLTNYAKELQKKVTLLQHFRSYLEGDEKPEGAKENLEDAAANKDVATNKDEPPAKRKIQDVIYVKKWMRTRHAIMFRLSNKIV